MAVGAAKTADPSIDRMADAPIMMVLVVFMIKLVCLQTHQPQHPYPDFHFIENLSRSLSGIVAVAPRRRPFLWRLAARIHHPNQCATGPAPKHENDNVVDIMLGGS